MRNEPLLARTFHVASATVDDELAVGVGLGVHCNLLHLHVGDGLLVALVLRVGELDTDGVLNGDVGNFRDLERGAEGCTDGDGGLPVDVDQMPTGRTCDESNMNQTSTLCV